MDAAQCRSVVGAGVGIGIYRCAHEWPVWLAGFFPAATLPAPFSSSDFYLAIDAGKIAGVLAYLALCYLLDRHRTSTALRALPSAVMVLGGACALLALLGAPVASGLVVGSLVLIGFGAGMLFCQWIEVCGMLTPMRVVQVLALSYIARLLIFALVTSMGPVAGSVLALLLAGSSFIQVKACTPHTADAGGWERAVPSRREAAGFRGLFLWVPVFAFAYGLGVGSTSMAHAAFETGFGTALAASLILAVSLKLGDRFDSRVLYAIALPLMTAGLVGIEFLNAAPSLSQVLLSAAFDSFRLLAFWEVCSFAYRRRTSAMFLGSCVRLLSLCVDDAAVCLMRFSPSFWDDGVVTLLVIMTAIFMGTLVYLPRIANPGKLHQVGFGGAAQRRGRMEDLVRAAELSPRETTVFQMLVAGKSAGEISEDLFISKGAVRSHMSRIYDKFGVHARADFDALFAEGADEGDEAEGADAPLAEHPRRGRPVPRGDGPSGGGA